MSCPAMRRFKLFVPLFCLAVSLVPSRASAQSVWDKIKQQAKQAQQQKQQQQQPGQQPQQQGQKPAQQQKTQSAQSNAPANDTGPITPLPGTKIEPVVLAPFEQGGQFAVSPHGVHVAALFHSGSRQVIIYDGVPGPKFDQFTSQGGGGPVPVIFSPDGNHYAYCGLSSDHFTVMVDGKEVGHGSETSTGALNCTIFFSPNGKHFYYFATQHSGDYRQGLAYSRLVVDGKTEIKVFEGVPSDLRNIIFSPDGDHFAAVFPSPTDPERSALFVDGKLIGIPGGEPQWSADSKHLFTRRNVPLPGTRQGSTWEALLDGKPIMRADAITLYVPPVGNMVVAMVQKLSVNPPISFLVVGGKQVPGSEVQSGNISNITFSPDGKHYAALYKNANSRSWIFADGKKGQEYGGIMLHNAPGRLPSNLLFTADSSRVVYESSTGSPYGEYLVLGDQESDELMSLTDTVIAPVGSHVAAEGYGQVSLDGKILKLPNVDPHTSQATALSFSPDASHVAFVLHARGGVTLYLDGQAQSAYTLSLQGPLTNAGTRPYIFSPDSKHIAYFCWQSNTAAGTEQGLCVDNKYVRLGPPAYYANLSFTSDSNHLFWTTSTPRDGFRLYQDGKPVMTGFPGAGLGFANETWQVGTDGTLSILEQDDTALKRVTITPSPDVNISTLVGGTSGLSAQR
jgi:Tol biopolymer transport system component